jgi:hypothetical protein
LGGVATKITYLNESTIAVTLDGQIIVRDILLGSPVTTKSTLAAATANNSVAIDYNT